LADLFYLQPKLISHNTSSNKSIIHRFTNSTLLSRGRVSKSKIDLPGLIHTCLKGGINKLRVALKVADSNSDAALHRDSHEALLTSLTVVSVVRMNRDS